MSDQIEDPFAGTDEDEDEFGTATREWLGLEDLDERLVCFDVLKVETRPSSNGNGTYTRAICNVVVLDGDPIPGYLETVPGTVEAMHINAAGVAPQLEQWHRRNPGKPFLARLDSVPSKQNKKIKVMGVRKHEVTGADKATARGPWRAYKAENPL